MDALRILVVDDEATQRELIGGFLKKQGHGVLLAAGGAEALARVRETQVDLVLSDFKMPGMSGVDLLQGVKAVNPEIPFILMTAYSNVENAVEAGGQHPLPGLHRHGGKERIFVGTGVVD